MRTDYLDLDPRIAYDKLMWKLSSDEQDYEKLTNQFKHDAIARKIVAKPAEDATRNGWRLVIPDNSDLQDKYQSALNDLKLQQVLSQQLIYRNLHGDGYITFGIKEANATDTSVPLDPANIEDIAFVHAFGQTHIQSYATNDNPTSIDYGKEQAIVIQPAQEGYDINKDGTQVPKPQKLDPVVIDRSRYMHISIDKFEDDRTGMSVLERCKPQLLAMSLALESTGKMFREFTFKVFKSDRLMNETEEQYRKDRAEIGRILNTESTAFIGSEDDLTKVSTQTGGINTLYDFAWQSLSASCNIPKSVLTGEQAGSLAGASQDVINYYDMIKATQEQVLKPELEYIVRLLMYSSDVADGSIDPDSIDWHIEFRPLWSPDDKTQSEILLNNVNAASTAVNSGIYDQDEAKNLIDGQGNTQVQGMQNTKTDSAEKEFEKQFTPEQVAEYWKQLDEAHPNG